MLKVLYICVARYTFQQRTTVMYSDNLRAQHSHEQEDMRQTLSSQENKVESQRQEVCKLWEELEERQTELATMMEEKRKREQELTESCQRQLQTQLRETKEVYKQYVFRHPE